MNGPVRIDLPHSIGAEEAKRRMQGNIGRLKEHIPGGAQVQSSWQGDRMNLGVNAMGQQVTGHIDVYESKVTVELMLPPALAFFAQPIEALLRKQGSQLLEDKSKKS